MAVIEGRICDCNLMLALPTCFHYCLDNWKSRQIWTLGDIAREGRGAQHSWTWRWLKLRMNMFHRFMRLKAWSVPATSRQTRADYRAAGLFQGWLPSGTGLSLPGLCRLVDKLPLLTLYCSSSEWIIRNNVLFSNCVRKPAKGREILVVGRAVSKTSLFHGNVPIERSRCIFTSV